MDILSNSREGDGSYSRNYAAGDLAKSIPHFDPLHSSLITLKKNDKKLLKLDFSSLKLNKTMSKPGLNNPSNSQETPQTQPEYVKALNLDNIELNSNLCRKPSNPSNPLI